MLYCNVSGQTLTRAKPITEMVRDSRGYIYCAFEFSDDWDGATRHAIFSGADAHYIIILENDQCLVPWEVTDLPSFTVSVVGYKGEDVRITTNIITVTLRDSGYVDGETPSEPTPDVYAQLTDMVQEAIDTAQSVRDDADAGAFNGEPGPQGERGEQGEQGVQGERGPQGVPGTAATITIGSVTESAPGGDASVTNSGTASAAVLDFVIPRGETGPAGATGATGPAGLGVPQPTAEDAGKIPVVNADGSGYELGNPAPEVDDTLSIPGSPADAAATGAAIEAVSPDDESVGAKPWSSKQIIDTLCPPLEVAGNPVVCYPVAGYPLGVKASWEPRQEGEGDPSPENVRPIVGTNVITVQRSGKNLLKNKGDKTIKGISWKFDDAGLLSITGEIGTDISDYYFFGSNEENAEAFTSDVDMIMSSNYVTNDNNNVFGARTSEGLIQNGGSNDSLIIPSGVRVYGIFMRVFNSAVNYSGIYAQLELGSTPTAYEPYRGDTFTIDLGQTVYGGTVDAVTGVVQDDVFLVELAVADMDNREDYPGWKNQKELIAAIGVPDEANNALVVILGADAYVASNADGGKLLSANTWVDDVLFLPASTLGYTQSELKEQFPDLVFQFALRRPTSITLQTAANAIPALPSTNTIYTDADSVTVTGRADPVQTINALNDRIAALEDAALDNIGG